jgi:predicted transglutaminase-like cysteine proteinase
MRNAVDGYCRRCGTPRSDLRKSTSWGDLPIFSLLAKLRWIGPLGGFFVFVMIILSSSNAQNGAAPASNGLLPLYSGQDYYIGNGNMSYQWMYYGVTFHLNCTLESPAAQLMDIYSQYRDPADRVEAMDSAPTMATPHDAQINEIAGHFLQASIGLHLNRMHTLNLMLSFVQAIRNVDDSSSLGVEEYWRVPVETLLARQGDMVDKSLLLASLCHAAGFDSVILFDGRDGVSWDQSHTSVGVSCSGVSGTYYDHNGGQYYCCEPSTIGYKAGDSDPVYSRAYIVPIG